MESIGEGSFSLEGGVYRGERQKVRGHNLGKTLESINSIRHVGCKQAMREC